MNGVLSLISSNIILIFFSFLCPSKSMKNMYLPRPILEGLDSILVKFTLASANNPKISSPYPHCRIIDVLHSGILLNS